MAVTRGESNQTLLLFFSIKHFLKEGHKVEKTQEAAEIQAVEFLKKIKELSVKGENEQRPDNSVNLEFHAEIQTEENTREYKEKIDIFLKDFPKTDLKNMLISLRDDEEMFKTSDKIDVFYYLILNIIERFKLSGENINVKLHDNSAVINYALSLLFILTDFKSSLTTFFKEYFVTNNNLEKFLDGYKFVLEDYNVSFLQRKHVALQDINIAKLSKFLLEADEKSYGKFLVVIGRISDEESENFSMKTGKNYEVVFSSIHEYLKFQTNILDIGRTNRFLFDNVCAAFDEHVGDIIRKMN